MQVLLILRHIWMVLREPRREVEAASVAGTEQALRLRSARLLQQLMGEQPVRGVR